MKFDGAAHEVPVQVRVTLCSLLNGVFVFVVPEPVKVNWISELTVVGDPATGLLTRLNWVIQFSEPISGVVLRVTPLCCKTAGLPLRVHWPVPVMPAEVDEFWLGVADILPSKSIEGVSRLSGRGTGRGVASRVVCNVTCAAVWATPQGRAARHISELADIAQGVLQALAVLTGCCRVRRRPTSSPPPSALAGWGRQARLFPGTEKHRYLRRLDE